MPVGKVSCPVVFPFAATETNRSMTESNMKNIYVVLYPNFTALDAFGPVQVFGYIDEYAISYVSLHGGIVRNAQGIRIITQPMSEIEQGGILLIPGGFGSREMIKDPVFIQAIREAAQKSEYTLCVCTGSALAAEAGLLDGKQATTNKTAFAWVADNHIHVKWNREARWVADGNIYTSAGVSAGTDMALGFVRDRFGTEFAEKICRKMEYHWNADPEHDTF